MCIRDRLTAEPHDIPLDAVLTDEGLAWQVPASK